MTIHELGIGERALRGAHHAYAAVIGEEHEHWADVHDFCRVVGVVDLLRTRNVGVVSILEIMEALAANGLYLRPKVDDERLVRQRLSGADNRARRDRILAMRRDAAGAALAPVSPVGSPSEELATWYPG